MTQNRVSGQRRIVGEPAAVVGAHGLPGMDYSDYFSLSTSVEVDAERWARAMFGDIPDRALRFIWNGICRFRLADQVGPDLIGGVEVESRSGEHIVLGLDGPMLVGRLVVTTAPGQVGLTTQMRYPTARGRVVWTLSSIAHRRLSPGLLLGSEKKLKATVAR